MLIFLTKIPENLALFRRAPIENRFALRGGGTRKNQCWGPCPKWGGVAKIDFYGGLTGGGKGYNKSNHTGGTMAKALTKYYIGDICWVISEGEYEEFVLPAIAEAWIGKGVLLRKKPDGFPEEIEFLTGDAMAAGWAQDSGVLCVLRFDDLEPEYQKRAEQLSEGGYTGFFESEAKTVGELSEEELKTEGFYEGEVTAEDLQEMHGNW